MFDEILDCLLNADTSGYPDPANLEDNGYTLEVTIEEMLYDCFAKAEDTDTKFFISDLITALDNGTMSWSEMVTEMESFEE